jgi:hypothetical protein
MVRRPTLATVVMLLACGAHVPRAEAGPYPPSVGLGSPLAGLALPHKGKASVAYFYQSEPHAPFPPLPTDPALLLPSPPLPP